MNWAFAGVLLLSLAVGPAEAGSGFFAGGAADGMAEAQKLDLQRRALDLDVRDGGNRYERLRQRQQADEIERALKRNNELLEQMRMDRLIHGR